MHVCTRAPILSRYVEHYTHMGTTHSTYTRIFRQRLEFQKMHVHTTHVLAMCASHMCILVSIVLTCCRFTQVRNQVFSLTVLVSDFRSEVLSQLS